MGTPVDRDDARVVDHFVQDYDVSRGLQNLIIVVI